MDHQHVVWQAGCSWKVLATVVALFWQIGQGGEWQVIWCFRRRNLNYDVGSFCISTMWLFNSFLVERTLRQELQRKKKSDKRDQGEFDNHGLPAYPTHPSPSTPSPYSSSSFSFFSSSSSSSFSSSIRRLGRPPGPASSPAGTCRTGTGMSAYRPGLLIPPGSKIMTGLIICTSYTIVTANSRLWFSYVFYSYRTWKNNLKFKKTKTKEPKTELKRTK